MPALTIKNIPDELYTRLKEAAKTHHRSLNSEIIYCVEHTLGSHKTNVIRNLASARALRNRTTSHPLTDDILSAAKNEGRP